VPLIFEVLETCPESDLVLREQAWINDFAKGRKLYNVTLAAARNGSRKVKADWVDKAQAKAELDIDVPFDAKAQAAFELKHKTLADNSSQALVIGYGLFLLMAVLAYKQALPWPATAVGMIAGLALANFFQLPGQSARLSIPSPESWDDKVFENLCRKREGP
jgi:hypothetical protein